MNMVSNSKKFGTDKKYKKKYDMIIYRVNNSNNYVNSKPCLSCALLIKNSKCIKNVFYSDENGIFVKIKANHITDNAMLLREQVRHNNMVITNFYSKRSNYISDV
jgi:deoxycytidylate deaminase